MNMVYYLPSMFLDENSTMCRIWDSQYGTKPPPPRPPTSYLFYHFDYIMFRGIS